MKFQLTGICLGTLKTETNFDGEKGEKVELGIQQQKEGGFLGETETVKLKLQPDHQQEFYTKHLDKLAGKKVTIPVNCRSWGMSNGKHGVSVTLLCAPSDILEVK